MATSNDATVDIKPVADRDIMRRNKHPRKVAPDKRRRLTRAR